MKQTVTFTTNPEITGGSSGGVIFRTDNICVVSLRPTNIKDNWKRAYDIKINGSIDSVVRIYDLHAAFNKIHDVLKSDGDSNQIEQKIIEIGYSITIPLLKREHIEYIYKQAYNAGLQYGKEEAQKAFRDALGLNKND